MSAANFLGYTSAESNPANTGVDFGRRLYDTQLSARARYADPYVPEQTDPTADATGRIPYHYNKYPAPPRKYAVPTAQKERHVARQAIRDAAKAQKFNRPDPITDEEVDMLQTAKDQVETAKFDKWFSTKYDPLRPGGFPEIMNLNPEFVTSRVQQAATDYEFAMRKEMIDTWGPQSMDDLYLMYMLDQGQISGPTLYRGPSNTNNYTAGMLSPYRFMPKYASKMAMPGRASSIRGARGPGEMVYNTDGALEQGSGMTELAQNMYKTNDAFYNAGQDGEPGASGRRPEYVPASPFYGAR